MPWNPALYNQFKTERFAPFEDLLALIQPKEGMEVIDLGCGTGELTSRLAKYLIDSKILGIDASQEMLREADSYKNEQVNFENRSIEAQLNLSQKWDLVFSNAAIQWVADHKILLPRIISTIRPGGQLVIQIPSQHHNISNILLQELAGEQPFVGALYPWERSSPVLAMEDYARILFDNGGKSITVFEKIYPVILRDAAGVFEWVSGTAFIPYLERLPALLKEPFTQAFKATLENTFSTTPVFYPFKRILMSALF